MTIARRTMARSSGSEPAPQIPGFSLTRLTFQVTHATDFDTNAERNFIIAELKQRGVIGDVNVCQPRQRLPATRVNHYITDGEIAAASLSASTASRPAAG